MVLLASRFQPGDEIEHDGNLVDAHPGGRLVEHEDFRLERHHHRDFELALVAVRKRGGALMALAGQRDPLQIEQRPLDQIDAQHPRPRHFIVHARRRLHREPDVFEHAQGREKIGELERAADAGARALGARCAA